MKESSLRAWQVLFLFVAVLGYFILLSSRNPVLPAGRQNAEFFQRQTMYSPAFCKAPDSCIDIKREEKSLKPGALPTQAQSGYCISVPVLLYHHIRPQKEAALKGQSFLNVDPSFFDLQMKYLTEHGYNTISADVLINALKTHSSLAPKSILITVDDGYRDFFTNAFPIIQKYGIKVNLMIPAGLIGGEDSMSWDQISQLKQSGLAYFVDHTWSHYAINHGSGDKIQYEILTGKQQLEQNTGQTVNVFAYPYGSFNNNAISVLQNEGFAGAFSTIPGFLQCDSFIMTLHRNHVGNAPLSSYGL